MGATAVSRDILFSSNADTLNENNLLSFVAAYAIANRVS
jgi:hypothetical protein